MLIASLTGWHGWAWQGWPALVSLGTLALAAATAGLATYTRNAVRAGKQQIDLSKRELEILEKQTEALKQEAEAVREQVDAVREQAEATKRQAELSASALEAAARPVLVGVSANLNDDVEMIVYAPDMIIERFQRSRIHYLEAQNQVFCSVPLRNVGAGIAFVQRVSILAGSYSGRISLVVIPPGEIARVRFTLPLIDQMGHRTEANEVTAANRGFGQFTIYVVYSGASRDIVTASEITVAQFPNGEFHVTRNAIFDGDSGERRLLVSSENLE